MVVGCGTAVQNKSITAGPTRAGVGDWKGAGDSLNTCTLIFNVQKGGGFFHALETHWSVFPTGQCFPLPQEPHELESHQHFPRIYSTAPLSSANTRMPVYVVPPSDF